MSHTAASQTMLKPFVADESFEIMDCLRPLFTLSKILGTFPLSCNSDGSLEFKWLEFRTAWCLFIACGKLFILFCQIGNMAHDLPLTYDNMVVYLLNFIFFLHASVVTIIVLRRASDLPQLFEYLRRSEATLHKYRPHRGDGLVRLCWTVTIVHFIIGVANSAFFVNAAKFRYKSESLRSYIRDMTDAYNMEKVMPWWMGGVAVFLVEGFCHCAWSFADMVIIISSLVLRRFYLRYNKILAKMDTFRVPDNRLDDIRKDHVLMANMVKNIDLVISQQTLISVLGDVGFIFSRLYLGISDTWEAPTLMERLDSGFSFCYVFGRTMCAAFCAAKLHEEAHNALKYVKMWPSAAANPADKEGTTGRILVINRFIKQLQHPPIGFTGSNYFLLDKSFMTRLMSALITYEVVVLQVTANISEPQTQSTQSTIL